MNDWQKIRISDIATIIQSNVDKIIYDDERLIKLCNYMDVYRNSIIKSDEDMSTGSVTQAEYSKFKLRKGQVIITKDSETPKDIARSAYVAKDFDNVVCGYHLAIITPREKLYGLYLKYTFDVPSYQHYFSRLANGVTRFGLTLPAIENAHFLLPPIEEQLRIVSILQTCDEYLDRLEQKILLKKRLKKSLMQHLLTGKKRLPGFTDKWRSAIIDDIAHVNMGQSPASSAYNENGDGMVLIQGNADMKNGLTISRIWTNEITKVAPAGSLIMTVRAPAGEIAKASSDVCMGRGVCSIESNYEAFLYHYLQYFKPQWVKYIQGSTFESINGSDIRKLPVLLPSLAESLAISKVLDSMSEDIVLQEQTKSIITQQKKYLLNNLVTGKIRTPETLSSKGAR